MFYEHSNICDLKQTWLRAALMIGDSTEFFNRFEDSSSNFNFLTSWSSLSSMTLDLLLPTTKPEVSKIGNFLAGIFSRATLNCWKTLEPLSIFEVEFLLWQMTTGSSSSSSTSTFGSSLSDLWWHLIEAWTGTDSENPSSPHPVSGSSFLQRGSDSHPSMDPEIEKFKLIFILEGDNLNLFSQKIAVDNLIVIDNLRIG